MFDGPTLTATDDKVSSILGEVTLLKVDVDGAPSPRVTWRFQGQEIPAYSERYRILGNGWLEIADVRGTDYGTYDCHATNVAGTARCQIKLEIQMPLHGIKIHQMQRNCKLQCQDFLGPRPVSGEEFENYVAEMHANSNWGFSSQYSVSELVSM